eukprot:Platyproteum_vivax@DN5767_c0_g1_i2.p1
MQLVVEAHEFPFITKTDIYVGPEYSPIGAGIYSEMVKDRKDVATKTLRPSKIVLKLCENFDSRMYGARYNHEGLQVSKEFEGRILIPTLIPQVVLQMRNSFFVNHHPEVESIFVSIGSDFNTKNVLEGLAKIVYQDGIAEDHIILGPRYEIPELKLYLRGNEPDVKFRFDDETAYSKLGVARELARLGFDNTYMELDRSHGFALYEYKTKDGSVSVSEPKEESGEDEEYQEMIVEDATELARLFNYPITCLDIRLDKYQVQKPI